MIRMSYGLSYANITTVTGSTHNLGFTLTDTQSDSTQGVQPRFLVKDGRPAWSSAAVRRSELRQWPRHAVVPRAARRRGRPHTRASISRFSGRSRTRWSPKSPTTAAWAAACRRDCCRTTRSNPAYLAGTARRCLNSSIIAGGGGCRLHAAVPGIRPALGNRRDGAPGAASLSAVPENRYPQRRRRPQRPLHLSRGMIRFEKRYSRGLAVPDFLCILQDADRCR